MQSEQFHLHADIEQRHWWFVARREILRSVIGTVLPPSPGTTIVDVGCGTGANLASLANDYRCVGIDTSQEAIRLAARRFPDVGFICGEASRLSSVIAEADLVMLTDVLEHVCDDFQLFSELLAVASPGTYFLVTVPADASLWSEHDRAFGHYRRYDRARLESVWQGLPVRPVFVSYFNTRLFPIVKGVRTWNQWRGRAHGAAGTDFALPIAPANYLLTRYFAGERRRLSAMARGERRRAYPRGVSLMALVQRSEGAVESRHRPEHVARDLYDPLEQHLAGSLS